MGQTRVHCPEQLLTGQSESIVMVVGNAHFRATFDQ